MVWMGGTVRVLRRVTPLVGEADYAGLTLVMSLTTDDRDRQTNWGVIVPSHDLPPIGDLLVLPAE